MRLQELLESETQADSLSETVDLFDHNREVKFDSVFSQVAHIWQLNLTSDQRFEMVEECARTMVASGKYLIEAVDHDMIKSLDELREFGVQKPEIGKKYIPVSFILINSELQFLDIDANSPPKSNARFRTLTKIENHEFTFSDNHTMVKFPDRKMATVVYMNSILLDSKEAYDELRFAVKMTFGVDMPECEESASEHDSKLDEATWAEYMQYFGKGKDAPELGTKYHGHKDYEAAMLKQKREKELSAKIAANQIKPLQRPLSQQAAAPQWRPSGRIREEEEVSEVSQELLGRYKTAAGKSASAADKVGDYEKGNKRFRGIVKATKKELEQDVRKHKKDVTEGAPELLKAEMPLVRHIEKELASNGYVKGTAEYDEHFKHAMSYYRKFGFNEEQGVTEGYLPDESKSVHESEEKCPHCSGPLFEEAMMMEKKDACYYKVKSRYKVWPSAYASGALVKCRKKGASNWGNSKNESTVDESDQSLDEDLHKWFKEKWVRFGPDGKIRGDCARGGDSEGKPKCLPQSKAQNLGKKARASAASRKRREDPNPDRSGKAINVNTKRKSNESLAEGSDQPTSTKKFYTDKKQWQRDVDNVNHAVHDGESEYLGDTGRSTVTINGREWARWSDVQQKGYIVMGSITKQGVTEGNMDDDCSCVKNEGEGDSKGLPHVTKELLQHIVKQAGTEGAHAIIKSLKWGDGAAKELLQLIVKDLKNNISMAESVKQRVDMQYWKEKCMGDVKEAKTSVQQSAIAISKKKKGMREGLISNIDNQSIVEDLSPDQKFDLIEDMVESLATRYKVDADVIWEDFDSVDDMELYEAAAWQRKEGKNKKGGLNKKGVASYRKEHPNSKLQTAVTTKPSKLKKGSKAAKRRKSFCARMGGMKGPMKDKNGKPTRKALALRKWNCNESMSDNFRNRERNAGLEDEDRANKVNANKPILVAVYYYNVPADMEEEALAIGLKKGSSGRWGLPQYDKSGASFAFRQSNANKAFGQGKRWEPAAKAAPVQAPVTQSPTTAQGYYFYEVPYASEQDAAKMGLKKSKSGKWMLPIYSGSGGNTNKIKVSADRVFGAGRWWAPKK